MTRTCDDQLAPMNDDDYAKTLLVALRAMVVGQMPHLDHVEMLPDGSAITRKGSGEWIPFQMKVPDNQNGKVVIWASPEGRQALGDPSPVIRKLLDRGTTIIATDAFKNAPVAAPAPTTKPNPNPAYAGYDLGYNRSVLANRVQNLLTTIAFARGRPQTRSVQLIGLGEQGPAALLARALAGDVVDRAAIDLNGFDFDQVRNDTDPMLLPGGLKYGGLCGFVPLCAGRPTLLSGVRSTGGLERAKRTAAVELTADHRDPGAMVEWIVQGSTVRP
jgi:hypothetical protein